MGSYIHTVSATSNGTINTDDLFTELNPAAIALIKRVEISVRTPASDARIIARLGRFTTAGAGGVAGTEVQKDQGGRAPDAAVLEKNGATNFTLGTLGDDYLTAAINGRAIWTWVPRGDEEKIRVEAAEFFGVVLQCDLVSIIVDVTIEWED